MNKELFKETENLLKNYNRLETEIKLIKAEIEDIKESYTGCVCIGYSEKSGPTNKFSSMVEEGSYKKRERSILS